MALFGPLVFFFRLDSGRKLDDNFQVLALICHRSLVLVTINALDLHHLAFNHWALRSTFEFIESINICIYCKVQRNNDQRRCYLLTAVMQL